MLSPRTIKSNRFLALGLLLFFFCNLYLWPNVQSSINKAAVDNGYVGPTDGLKVLDLRFSYSPETVSSLFHNWQHAGKLKFVGDHVVQTYIVFETAFGCYRTTDPVASGLGNCDGTEVLATSCSTTAGALCVNDIAIVLWLTQPISCVL